MSINAKMIKELADMVAPKAAMPARVAAKQAIAKEQEELKKALEEEEGGADPEDEGGADPEDGAGADPEEGAGADPEDA